MGACCPTPPPAPLLAHGGGQRDQRSATPASFTLQPFKQNRHPGARGYRYVWIGKQTPLLPPRCRDINDPRDGQLQFLGHQSREKTNDNELATEPHQHHQTDCLYVQISDSQQNTEGLVAQTWHSISLVVRGTGTRQHWKTWTHTSQSAWSLNSIRYIAEPPLRIQMNAQEKNAQSDFIRTVHYYTKKLSVSQQFNSLFFHVTSGNLISREANEGRMLVVIHNGNKREIRPKHETNRRPWLIIVELKGG